MKTRKELPLTQVQLRNSLVYDPATGVFTWLIGRFAGRPAGWYSWGYVEISLIGVRYKAHRLAWFYTYGVWPTEHVDHINGVRDDNRIANLREATNRQNMHNCGTYKRNTSGFRGVSFCKQTGRWAARIRDHGHKKHLGRFDTPEEAHEVYCLAADLLRGEFAHHGQTKPVVT